MATVIAPRSSGTVARSGQTVPEQTEGLPLLLQRGVRVNRHRHVDGAVPDDLLDDVWREVTDSVISVRPKEVPDARR